VLADVGHLHQVGVEARGFGSLAEGLLVHPGATGGNDDAVQVMLADRFFQQVLPRVGAHVLVVEGYGHAGDLFRGPGHPFNVYGSRYVFATVADKYADSGHKLSLLG